MARSLLPPTLDRLPLRRLPADYLSFTLDTSLVLGGRWWGPSKKMSQGVAVDTVDPLDLDNPTLVARARALAPATLRIGGTEADRVRYHLKKGPVPAGTHDYALRKADWKRIHRFVRRARLDLLFTLSAGPADRDEAGAWQPDNARDLIGYTVRKGYPVSGWELGNEVNGFPFIHGLAHRVSARQYSADFERFAALMAELAPEALSAGPSSAVWPLIGEPNPLIPGFSRSQAARHLGALSWHYYPQQSHHGPVATRRVGTKTMLNARNLDGVRRWTRMVGRAQQLCRNPGVQNWMTETAHALYGGEPGISDTFASTLWWLDELGLVAREGVDKVFRQSLVGARYGLLDQETLDPRPDFWASFLWKKLMGPVVYPSPRPARWPASLRAYLHGDDRTPWSRTLLVVNLHQTRTVPLGLEAPVGVWCLQGASGLCSPTLTVNGFPADDDLVDDWGRRRLLRKYAVTVPSSPVLLPPLSATFVELSLGNEAV
jgi:heparanase 1